MGAGAWQYREEGDWICFEVTHPSVQGALCAATVFGEVRGYRLGTLLPSENGLALTRKLKRSVLEQAECYPPQELRFHIVASARTALAPEGFEPVEHLSDCFADPFLAQTARLIPFAFRKPLANGGFLLRIPYDGTGGFPLLPIFCFARLYEEDEAPMLEFAFDEHGRAKLLNSL